MYVRTLGTDVCDIDRGGGLARDWVLTLVLVVLLQQTKPTIAFLIKLERLLQTGQFKVRPPPAPRIVPFAALFNTHTHLWLAHHQAFWEHRSAPEVDDARAMLERVAGFDDHVRRCTCCCMP